MVVGTIVPIGSRSALGVGLVPILGGSTVGTSEVPTIAASILRIATIALRAVVPRILQSSTLPMRPARSLAILLIAMESAGDVG